MDCSCRCQAKQLKLAVIMIIQFVLLVRIARSDEDVDPPQHHQHLRDGMPCCGKNCASLGKLLNAVVAAFPRPHIILFAICYLALALVFGEVSYVRYVMIFRPEYVW